MSKKCEQNIQGKFSSLCVQIQKVKVNADVISKVGIKKMLIKWVGLGEVKNMLT